jgi:hypothetical protein
VDVPFLDLEDDAAINSAWRTINTGMIFMVGAL